MIRLAKSQKRYRYPVRWVVKGFLLASGATVIEEWEAIASARAVAKLDQRLNFMKDRNVPDWPYDYAHALTGAGGIWEIKFEYGNVAYRPLFCFGPYPEEFTVLSFAEERGGRWKPQGALAAAVVRRDELKQAPNRAIIND